MAQAGKGRLNYRCPSCFMRDIDIDMFYDKEKASTVGMRRMYLRKMSWQGSGTA